MLLNISKGFPTSKNVFVKYVKILVKKLELVIKI